MRCSLYLWYTWSPDLMRKSIAECRGAMEIDPGRDTIWEQFQGCCDHDWLRKTL